jgi:transcription-repair coupling factor (superfamily II helicase)
VVVPFDGVVVREALLREQMHGGQSFVVCSRITDLEPIRARLSELLPELDLVVAHDRMKTETLDESMVAFARGEHDLLLTTNIIESGLDIPSANTMLVWHRTGSDWPTCTSSAAGSGRPGAWQRLLAARSRGQSG